ncbi:MAG TPA: hypothetical protein VHW09_26905 [Bryobacteraceae bacterium]|jgi:hypothetical protein|nr:hypothetical protein [Bryobacteraceae bacterium]
MTTYSMLAPAAKAGFTQQCASSTTYTADAYGFITGIALADVGDLYKGGCIPLGQSGVRSTFSQTVDPSISNDNTQDFGIGSEWFNTTTGLMWRCQSAATGAAVWLPQVSSGVLVGRLIGANMNVTTDQAINMTGWTALNKFRLTKVTVKNASVSLTTAAGGIYTAVSKGGTAYVASGQAYSALTGATLALDLTIATTPGVTPLAAASQLYLALSTAQGSAATADVYLFGDAYV